MMLRGRTWLVAVCSVAALGLVTLSASSAPADQAAGPKDRPRSASARWIPFGSTDPQALMRTSSVLPPYLAGMPAPLGYRLVWSDEFNGTTVDPSRWNVRDNQNYGASLGVDQCYRADDVSVAGGQLLLQLRRQTVACGGINPDTGNDTYYFTSGAVTTRGSQGRPRRFAFTRGYVEAAVQLPQGNAYWGAFWLTGGDGITPWPAYGEFDAMEQVGPRPDQVIQTVHYRCQERPSCNTNADHSQDIRLGRAGVGPLLTALPQPYSGATTSRSVRYGLLWTDKTVTWYVDGVPVRSFDGLRVRQYGVDAEGRTVILSTSAALAPVEPSWATVLNTPHAIDLNLAYGGSVPRSQGYTGGEVAGGYDDGNFLGEPDGVMKVDYVRVYQLR